MDGDRKVSVLAAGHNKKVPLLLVGTYSNMLPGEVHKKVWQVNKADGTTEWHCRETAQPRMHALYRKYMNVVDLHNKLRQGVVAMADVWQTRSWADRHFGEGLGLWEVNVYKALLYFQSSKWKGTSHSEFRARLAYTMMTLGRSRYPADLAADGAAPAAATAGGQTTAPSFVSPTSAHCHEYGKLDTGKTCSYCGKETRRKCLTCETFGRGIFYACNTGTGRVCMQKHAAGVPISHGNWCMSQSSKDRLKQRRSGSGMSSADSSDNSGSGPSQFPESSNMSPDNSAASRAARGASRAANVRRQRVGTPRPGQPAASRSSSSSS